MNYPLISEYVEAIKLAEDNFEELSYLRPVLDADGQPVMSSGNFAVVFKMKDERDGKLYAVRCFHRDQEGREESYRLIEEELKDVESPYLVSFRYMDKELFVDSSQTDETEFPVLLMDWVEGITLDKYLRENIDDQHALEMLAYRFSQLAQWLIPQPFAHGDLKPDNILVREDGTLVLVDYDGMYVPAMKGQKARELGSPDFRHPLRTEDDFDEHIDDFPLVSILLSLKAISLNPQLLEEYGATDRLLFSEIDYRNIASSSVLRCLLNQIANSEISRIYSLFIIVLSEKVISDDSYKLVFAKKEKNSYFEIYKKQSRFDSDSKYCLSCLLMNGFGCEQNVNEGIHLIEELAEKGFTKAQFKLGRYYELGEGVPKDKEKAIEWYIKAAEQGFGKAQINLGRIFGLSHNYEEAVKWFTMAATQGLAQAQYILGELCAQGLGTSQSYQKAVEWYTKAAAQGFGAAQYSLGHLYRQGQGVPQNSEKANECFIKSAEKGDGEALKLLTQVTADDLANAWTDDNGVLYSVDKKRLLKVGESFKGEHYSINNETRVICTNAFWYCKMLTDVTIPQGVSFIGEHAFSGCKKLIRIAIPRSVINIGDGAFYNCDNLKSIVVDIHNPQYDSRDNCNAIIESHNNTLIVACQNTRIPNGVMSIRRSAFSIENTPSDITIPDSVTNLPDGTFQYCHTLSSVTIQNGVKSIGKEAFSSCLNITNIVIPNSVTTIGEQAFEGCDKLISITIPRSVTSIGRGIFSGIRMNGDTNGACCGYNNLERIIVDIDNPKYDSRDNCNAIIETQSNTLIAGCQNTVIPNGITNIDTWAFEGCIKLTKIVIPGSVANIPDFVFEFCTGLTTVTLHDGITSIGKMAFYGCENLSNIVFPDSITTIGERAFAGCDKLTRITIPYRVRSIGEEAFAGMGSTDDYQGFFDGRNNLERIMVDERNAFYDSRNDCNAIIETISNTLIAGCKNTIIPNGVKTIGKRAFAYCVEMTEIEIPDGVTEIMDYAFYQCKSLKKVVLPTSIIKIGKNAFKSDVNYGMWGETLIPIFYYPNGTKANLKDYYLDDRN